jgi:NAD(P)-dependent dehydrogenase (short-subunit alcohol dehydrogenase family)
MRSIKDMSILITGGGSGIGEGTSRYFARHGAKVTISGRRREPLEAVAASIGPACRAVVGDVTSEADRAAMIEAAVAHGGGIDVLFNNAGNILKGSLNDFKEPELLGIFNANVVGPMLLTAAAVPELEKRKGSIIFVGSVHTRLAFPGRWPYAATKGAIQTLTRVLAAELGPRGIRVNCVVPGAVPTEINIRAGLFSAEEAKTFYENMGKGHPLGRAGTPEEIAEGIAYLVCAEWTTGAILDIDGGLGLGATNK